MSDIMNYNWNFVDLQSFATDDDHCNITCIHCDHSAKLYFGPLLIKHGPRFDMGPYLKNLRCSKCGERGATPRTTSHTPGKVYRPFFCPISQKSIYDCVRGACKKNCQRRELPKMGEL